MLLLFSGVKVSVVVHKYKQPPQYRQNESVTPTLSEGAVITCALLPIQRGFFSHPTVTGGDTITKVLS